MGVGEINAKPRNKNLPLRATYGRDGKVTAADVESLLEAVKALLIAVLVPTPQPTNSIRDIARRHGVSMVVLSSVAHAMGVVQLRGLGKYQETYWALPLPQEGSLSGTHDGIKRLSLMVRGGGS